MLHKDPFIISPETFALIQQLQAFPELKDFYLVGGTALALQIGHRNSIDIDLFTRNEFLTEDIIALLKTRFEIRASFQKEKNTLLTEINKIKTDFIRHDFPLIKQPFTEDGITYVSCEDIAAMKLNAIANSGQRLKDFIDLYYLLERFCITQMIEFFKIKYPNINPLVPLKAVSYFEDIDPDIDPPKMKTKLSLASIQKRIEKAVLNPQLKFLREK